MAKEDGGTAFPRDDRHTGTPGMTLRDWFAGQALVGLMSVSSGAYAHTEEDIMYVARAYALADAMLKERKR